MATQPIRVCVVEDHPVIREGMVRLLQLEKDMMLVAQYGDGLSAFDGIAQAKPDVVVTNVGIPGLDGIQLCRRVLSSLPDTRVLIVSLIDEADTVIGAFLSGARGYLLKEYVQDFCHAVRALMDGQVYLGPGLSAEIRAAVAKLCSPAPLDADPAA